MQRLSLLSLSLLGEDVNIDQMNRATGVFRSLLGAKRKRMQATIDGLRGQSDAKIQRIARLQDEIKVLQTEYQADNNKIFDLEKQLKKDTRLIDLIDDEFSGESLETPADTLATTRPHEYQDDEMDELAEAEPLWADSGRFHNPTDDETEPETEPQTQETEPRLRTRKRRAPGHIPNGITPEEEAIRSANTPHKQQRKRRRTRQTHDADADAHADADADEIEIHQVITEKVANGQTINFEAVYVNGQSEHQIIEYPQNSNNWFILQCKNHMFKISEKAFLKSIRHVEGQGHYCASKKLAAVKEMGVLVMNCDRQKAARNNKAAKPDPSSARKVRTSISTKFEGITNPEIGGLYIGRKGFRKAKDPHWTVMIILPWGSFKSISMTESITKTGLADKIPNCYRSKNGIITGWGKHFEEGGSKVGKRLFPVLCFGDLKTPVRNGRYLDLPPREGFVWIGAPALRPLNKIAPDGTTVRGYENALDYLAKVVDVGITPALAECKSRLLQSPESSGLGCYSEPRPAPSRSSFQVHIRSSTARKSLESQRRLPLQTPRRHGLIHQKAPMSR